MARCKPSLRSDVLDPLPRRWIYNHPSLYNLLDVIVSLGMSHYARREALKGIRGRVLEVGVGSGLSAKWLSGEKIFGVDVPLPMAKVAGKKGVRTCLARACNLPFKNHAFDTVVFFFTLQVLNHPRQALLEALRVGRRVVMLEYAPLPAPWKFLARPSWEASLLAGRTYGDLTSRFGS